jgi:hypothetical protein
MTRPRAVYSVWVRDDVEWKWWHEADVAPGKNAVVPASENAEAIAKAWDVFGPAGGPKCYIVLPAGKVPKNDPRPEGL